MEEYSSEFSNLPDIGSLLQQRIAAKQSSPSTPSTGFDPHKLMVKKHKVETGEELPEIPEAPQWPEADIKTLEDYCQRMGIIGYSTKQNPRIALMQLKQQVGDYSGIPLEERVPVGYQKSGTLSMNAIGGGGYNPPPLPKKTLLNG